MITFGEWAIVLLVLLLVFGPSRVKEVARSLGEAAREFKAGLEGEPAAGSKRKKK